MKMLVHNDKKLRTEVRISLLLLISQDILFLLKSKTLQVGLHCISFVKYYRTVSQQVAHPLAYLVNFVRTKQKGSKPTHTFLMTKMESIGQGCLLVIANG
jgi:hypothetical protein